MYCFTGDIDARYAENPLFRVSTCGMLQDNLELYADECHFTNDEQVRFYSIVRYSINAPIL